MSSYSERIWCNVPSRGRGLAISGSEVGRVSRQPDIVELRRWGKVYCPLGFQADIIDGLTRRLRQGPVVGLIALPTGAGKTRTAAWLCLSAWTANSEAGDTLVWIAPQRELVNQAAEAVQATWWSGQGPDSLDVRIVRSSRDLKLEARPTCLFLTPSMARSVMGEIASRRVSAVVFDEAHHAAAAVFSEVWRSVRAMADRGLAIGLTATPSRRDSSEDYLLREAFGGVVYCSASLGRQPVRKLIKQRVLSRPRFSLIPNLPRYARVRGPEDMRTLKQLVSDPDRWRAVIACISEMELGRIVTYALDREHGRALTHHLRGLGVKAEYLDGETPTNLRLGILERFREGRTRVLVNVALLIEGVDCPAAEALVLTYPVRHPARLQQMVGRVLRGPAIGGTKECRIWGLEGSQKQLDESLFATRYRYRGWKVETLTRSGTTL